MTMRVSFKVSKTGARFRPKPKPETPTVLEDDDVDVPPKIPNKLSVIATTKPSNQIGHQAAVQDDQKFLHPYDRTSESLLLVNDSVGTLALGHFYDKDTVAAVVIGTGTNACYLERADAVIKCQGLLTTSGGMVINMEWGNFWSSYLPRTSFDINLDVESQNPNDQGFEKMISGMYLGDIVRRVILRMSLESGIFGPVSSKLLARFVLRLL